MTIPVYHFRIDNYQEFRSVYAQVRYRAMLGKFISPFSSPVGTCNIQISGSKKQQIIDDIYGAYEATHDHKISKRVIEERLERIN